MASKNTGSAREHAARSSASLSTSVPERIEYAFADSSFGPLLLARSDKGLVWLGFVDSEETALAEMVPRFRGAQLDLVIADGEPWVSQAVAEAESLGRAGGGAKASRDAVPLDLRGTPFQRAVWDAMLAIPYGETRSYAEIARSIGRPTAVRAAAQACGANPVAIIVPCHRVIGSDGSLTGYASGLDRKRDLLAREAPKG